MKIVLYEMKKIWNINILLIIMLVCALFYIIFMSFYIEIFPNGHPSTENFNYSVELTQRFGQTLEPDELSKFIKIRDDLRAEANTYINNNPIFSEVGIYTYADYDEVYERQNSTEAETKAIWTLLGEESNFVEFKLQSLGAIERFYDYYPKYTLKNLFSEARNEREIVRLTEIRETEEYRNIMSGEAFENTITYIIYFSILVILAVLILVSPSIVTDRSRNVHLLQYTAKHGRKILKQQFIAVVLSAFMLTTILLLVFGGIYSTTGVSPFWNNGLTSFLNQGGSFFLFDLTFGQYICIYIVLLYTLCVGAAAVSFMLSRFSQNLITLILKLIPFFGLLAVFCNTLFNYTFNANNILYRWTGIVGIEPVVCGFVLVVGLIMSLYTVRRERNVDVI